MKLYLTCKLGCGSVDFTLNGPFFYEGGFRNSCLNEQFFAAEFSVSSVKYNFKKPKLMVQKLREE